MRRVLVTGATGFIGSAIVRRLAEARIDVLALGSGKGPVFDCPGVEWRQVDLLGGEPIIRDLVAQERPPQCIHAAWYTNHADYLVHPVNLEWIAASLRLAEAIAEIGGRLTALGSCFEYELGAGDGACSESRTPLGPATYYGQCKVELSKALAQRGIDHSWPRVFFVYGPGDRAGRLVPTALARFRAGEGAGPTYGGLRRDYIHVDDLADQIVRILFSPVQGPINTGTGEAPTLSEIFGAAAAAVGRPELARKNSETGDQPELIVADLARFRAEVGGPGARSIRQGLIDLIIEDA